MVIFEEKTRKLKHTVPGLIRLQNKINIEIMYKKTSSGISIKPEHKIIILWHIFSMQELWEPEKQPLLGNGSVTGNNRVTIGSCVFCVLRADNIYIYNDRES
jgi:hypothetical protein